MRFSTKCWSEHILSAYKATKHLKHPLYMTFKRLIFPLFQSCTTMSKITAWLRSILVVLMCQSAQVAGCFINVISFSTIGMDNSVMSITR